MQVTVQIQQVKEIAKPEVCRDIFPVQILLRPLALEGKGFIAGDDRIGNHLIEASLKAGGLQGQSHLSPLVIPQDVQMK